MNKNEKAATGAIRNGSNAKSYINAGAINNSFGVSYFSQFARFGQSLMCQKCKSDYMKFSVNGFCQDCQQKVEFIVREHPHVAQNARSGRREAAL